MTARLPLLRLRRCPACRLAGRRAGSADFDVEMRNGESWWYVVCPCGARSGEHSSTLKAQGEWNDLSRAAKRGMRAKRGGRMRVRRVVLPFDGEYHPDFRDATFYTVPATGGTDEP